MLRRIAVSQARLGMFIHKFEGDWLDHPFWRARFLIQSEAQLLKLRSGAITHILIDESRGAPLDPPAAAAPAAPAATASIPAAARAPEPEADDPAPDLAPCSAAEELRQATKLVGRSTKAVKRMFGEVRLGRAIQADRVAPLVEEISASVARNSHALISIARLKTRDEYTYMHSVAVCGLMIALARQMNLPEDEVRDLGVAGMLHDVGKMAVPDAVLQKPGRLTDEEFAVVRAHPERGHELLAKGSGIPAVALDVCLHHHEKVDGTGYPYGLRGERISLAARMGAICDVYDAVTSARPYKAPWSPADSLGRMLEWEGHFDAHVMAGFIRSVGIYPLGMLVRLRSGRLGVVIEDCPDDPTRPLVRTFYDTEKLAFTDWGTERIDVGVGPNQVIGRARPGEWRLADWDTLCAALIAGDEALVRAA